jgi:4-carboxymuconolactone decarboxylase
VTDQQRALVGVSAAVAAGDADPLAAALQHAATVCEPLQVEEALLQSYLFLGYPAALRALGEWRRVSGHAAPEAADDVALWEERGAATCQRVYGGQYERLRDNIRALHPDMERWMVVEGYGKVLGRPGLDLATRELCIIALLAQQDAAPQLYSHLRGALNAGADTTMVAETVELLAPLLPDNRRAALHEQWHVVQQRRSGAEN